MTMKRIFLAGIAALCAFWMFLFYKMSFGGYDSVGSIFWSGMINGQFEATYFAMLYLPPLLFVVCSYLALCRTGVK
jgi:hypothetical protein